MNKVTEDIILNRVLVRAAMIILALGWLIVIQVMEFTGFWYWIHFALAQLIAIYCATSVGFHAALVRINERLEEKAKELKLRRKGKKPFDDTDSDVCLTDE